MANVRTLIEEEIRRRLGRLPGWELREGKLHREFRFPDFVAAFGFMAGCAALAEQMNHHPEWFNAYRIVKVDLSTHDAGGVSEMDLKMAERMSELAGRLGG